MREGAYAQRDSCDTFLQGYLTADDFESGGRAVGVGIEFLVSLVVVGFAAVRMLW